MLKNIIGLTERVRPPPINLQWPQPGSPSDPKPSISAFGRSLQLWRRELKGLTWADVYVAIQFYHGQEEVVIESWLEDSEVQALASAMGVCVGHYTVVRELPVSSLRYPNGFEFKWGEWLLDREDEAV